MSDWNNIGLKMDEQRRGSTQEALGRDVDCWYRIEMELQKVVE